MFDTIGRFVPEGTRNPTYGLQFLSRSEKLVRVRRDVDGGRSGWQPGSWRPRWHGGRCCGQERRGWLPPG
eukprot:6025831-Pyramimonas_sp.AAC.1